MNDSLNELRLNNHLLASLFANVLVDTMDTTNEQPAGSKPANPASMLKFLGNNNKNITILVAEEDHTFLPEEALSFLTRILQACQLNIADTAIVNTAKQPGWYEAFHQLQPDKVISFGVPVPGTEIELFSIEPVNGILWMTAPPLTAFIKEPEQEKAIKTRLWSCLKQVFQIK